MIIACNKVATDCSMHVPCDVYGKSSILSTGILGPHDFEYFFPTGVEFPVPFNYDIWEVVTWVDDWLKRYYLIGMGGRYMRHTAYPVYVNSYHIPDFSKHSHEYYAVPDTTLLLRGMSAWFSFYYSRPMRVITPQMVYLNNLISNSSSNWSVRDELFMEILLGASTYCNSYNMFYEFEKIREELESIDSHIREYTACAHEPEVPEALWNKMRKLLGQPIDKTPSDEFDVLLNHSSEVDIYRLQNCIFRTHIEPPIQHILDVSKEKQALCYNNQDFHQVLKPSDDGKTTTLSLLTEIADVILIDGYFDFHYTFDLTEGKEIEDYAWCIHATPGRSRAFKSFLYSSIDRMKETVTKLELHLSRGHLIADITDCAGKTHRSTYCLALHMMGPSGIILLDDYQRMPHS